MTLIAVIWYWMWKKMIHCKMFSHISTPDVLTLAGIPSQITYFQKHRKHMCAKQWYLLSNMSAITWLLLHIVSVNYHVTYYHNICARWFKLRLSVSKVSGRGIGRWMDKTEDSSKLGWKTTNALLQKLRDYWSEAIPWFMKIWWTGSVQE